MPLRFFTIPAKDSDLSELELNRFLAGHKVVSIERQLVDAGMNSFWAICVDYLNSSSTQSGRPTDVSRNRVDYKKVLSPEEFTIFSQLREFRKQTAQTEAVPVYALFTNEQIALMVQRRCQSKTDLLGIDGIGDAKIEKYAVRLLKILSKMPEASDAADSESV